MKYPYIGKGTESGSIILMTGKGEGIVIDSKTAATHPGKFESTVDEDYFKNITREYLDGKCVKIESHEHSKLVQKVAFGAGFQWPESFGTIKHTGYKFLFFRVKGLMNCGHENNSKVQQITIPLPPKQIQTATLEEEFEMQQIMKNNGDNLVLGCEDSNCEWPCVNDEVVFTDLLQHYDQYKDDYCNKPSKVIARFKSSQGEFITVHREYCAVMTVRIDRILQDGALAKPKTPEEELRDDIKKAVYLVSEGEEDSLHITSILSKYNITKKPQ